MMVVSIGVFRIEYILYMYTVFGESPMRDLTRRQQSVIECIDAGVIRNGKSL